MLVRYREEGVLDKAQLSPEALEAKEKSTEELMKIQWALRNCAAALPQDQQMQFAADFEAAMKSAEKQVRLSCSVLFFSLNLL